MKPYSETAKYQKISNHKTIHIFCTKLQIPRITNFTLNSSLTLTSILESSYKKNKTQTFKINPQAYCKKFSTWKQILLIKATYLKKPLQQYWLQKFYNIYFLYTLTYRFCGLVFRVPGYRYRGPGFDSRRYQIF
jgi:hypothetical protein